MSDGLLEALMAAAADCPDLPDLLEALGGLLEAHGHRVDRLNFSLPTLHPEIVGIGVVWVRGRRAAQASLPHGELESARFLNSPLPRVMFHNERVIRALDPDAPTAEFQVTAELAAQGYRGYAALPLPLGDRTGVISLATYRPLDPSVIAAVDRVRSAVGLLVQLHEARRFSATLLDTYLGHGPGLRVLRGAVRRGDVTRLPAALWYADLRGFTETTLHLTPEETIAFVNAAFEVMVDHVEPAGGDVLKFMGDALLAVFPLDPPRAAARARDAALAVQRDLAALSATRRAAGQPPIAAGIALHAGEVLYGNIGGRQRLDFTVIGEAVNFVARVEGQCGALGHAILASEAFVALAPGGWAPVGALPLKGFPGRYPLFASETS